VLFDAVFNLKASLPIAVLFEAVKELHKQIDDIKKQVA
jgi:hypothetical protein